MKLKYKVERKDKNIIVSLDTPTQYTITPKMMEDVNGLFKCDETLVISAAKAELHWRLTNKNMGLPEYIRSMRYRLWRAIDLKDIYKKNEEIKQTLKWMNDFFDKDSSVY